MGNMSVLAGGTVWSAWNPKDGHSLLLGAAFIGGLVGLGRP
jgi:hypothetical protein